MSQRRDFLLKSPFVLAAASAGLRCAHAEGTSDTNPGAPPTFNAAPPVGPQVSETTFGEAEKLMQVTLTPAEREMAAASWSTSMAPLIAGMRGEQRTRCPLPQSVAPASVWQPELVDGRHSVAKIGFHHGISSSPVLPVSERDIAYAPVTHLAHWIKSRQLSAERLTRIYLDRIAMYDGQLRSVITLDAARALSRARELDRELKAGKYRGPLHGIPYGVKDLLDTKGVATTWGAEPLRHRVPDADAVVVRRLDQAGAIMLAKLSLGALALNDVWFGGQTMNPWNLDEGASGSSAGPGAATAAGLVAFAIGSETGGSIVSPSMRCGVTGLRPTFGRVARTGAMTLAWSLDKLGPMTRYVEDAIVVLEAINGADAGDVYSVDRALNYDARSAIKGLRVGYVANWMKEAPATPVDQGALDMLISAGLIARPVTLPDWPFELLNVILFAEAAAAFDDMLSDGSLKQLKMQVPDAWPNMFRSARFLSAVDFVQAERLRRKVADQLAHIFEQVDIMLVPSLRDDILTITNHTGHPSLTVRTGWVDIHEPRSDWAPDPAHPVQPYAQVRRVPHGVTLIGRLFDESSLARVGAELERRSGVAEKHPPGF